MFTLYFLQIFIALVSQYGQATTTNVLYALVSYFTYAQIFIVVATAALWSLIMDKIFKRDGTKWYKTQRFAD